VLLSGEVGVEGGEQTGRAVDAVSHRSPRAAKDIAKRAGFSAAAAQALLGVLELEGIVEERERGWVRPKPKKERGLL